MRVFMGEIIDVSHDFTTKNLTLKQKVSVIWQSLLADSKFLGNKKKQEQERDLREKNNRIDRLRDGLLANLEYHLTANRTLSKYNEEASVVQFAIDRVNSDILPDVMKSHEFNSYAYEEVQLDQDIVNSFGNYVPVIYSFSQKEV